MSRIILTVPHAKCPASKESHLCDIDAPAAADVLEKKMRKMLSDDLSLTEDKRILEKTLVGDISRDICDLNRPWCKDRPWRRKLRKRLEDASKSTHLSWLLDIHSFPPYGFSKDKEEDYEIVLLDNQPDYFTFHRDTIDLSVWLLKHGIRAQPLKGTSDYNSIAHEALLDFKLPHVFLLEFNENLSSSRRDEIIDQIVAWTKKKILEEETTKKRDNNTTQEYQHRHLVCSSKLFPFSNVTNNVSGTIALPSGEPIYYTALKENLIIIRDDLLCGGTKSRIVDGILPRGYKEYIYVSNWFGGAQVAVAIGVKRINETKTKDKCKAIIFTESWSDLSKPKKSSTPAYVGIAMEQGAQYITVPKGSSAFRAAQKYVDENPTERYLVPNGFDSPKAIAFLSDIGGVVRDFFSSGGDHYAPAFDEFWSVAATGMLTRSMQTANLARSYWSVKLFADAPIDIGLAVPLSVPHGLGISTPTPRNERPPFPSHIYYDAKGWQSCLERHKKYPHLKIIYWNVM